MQPPSAQVQREWVLCAIAAAGARFLPVPLADDVVKDRATRTAVARTWRARGLEPAPDVIAVLSGDTTGALTAIRRAAARLPLTLAIFPFRKARLVLTAVQGVSGDLLQVLLLARSVDRCLAAGWFDVDDDAERLRRAHLIRQAHDRAVHGADLRALRLALGSALRQVHGLPRQARDFARQTFGGGFLVARSADPVIATEPITGLITEPAAEPITGEGEPRAGGGRPLGTGADRVQEVLKRPDSVRILADLDARFDAALIALSPGGPNPTPALSPPSTTAD